METVERVILICPQYKTERQVTWNVVRSTTGPEIHLPKQHKEISFKAK